MNNNIKAILLTVSGSFFAVLMESLIRSAQYDSNVYTIGFLRFLFGLIIIFPYLIKKKFIPYKTKNFKFYFIRGLFNLPMMILGFGALVYVPFEQFKALHFLSPIIVVLLSFIIFREKIYMYRILALVIGFIGMLIIVRPGIVDFNIGTIMILISLTFWSFIVIVSKFVSKNDSPITLVTYQYTIMTIFSLPLAIYFWQMPSLNSLIFVFIGAISGIFYLRLLAKSIGKLGKESSGVSKLQLLVPVCLFIFASKLGSLDIFPAMIGFFIYKPSLILYFSRS